ncbi:MAG: TetR/AcrR family transcriptional regulator [Floccifex sp.]
MNKKKNKQYEQTHQKILNELFHEIENDTTPSISKICKNIQINRSTFYEHYESLEDLFNEAQDHVYQDFLIDFPLAIVNANYDFYVSFAKNVKKNKNFYKIFFSINDRVFPIQKGYSELKSNLIPYFHQKGIIDETLMRYRIIAYEASFTNVFKAWVQEDCQSNEKEIAKIVYECCKY